MTGQTFPPAVVAGFPQNGRIPAERQDSHATGGTSAGPRGVPRPPLDGPGNIAGCCFQPVSGRGWPWAPGELPDELLDRLEVGQDPLVASYRPAESRQVLKRLVGELVGISAGCGRLPRLDLPEQPTSTLPLPKHLGVVGYRDAEARPTAPSLPSLSDRGRLPGDVVLSGVVGEAWIAEAGLALFPSTAPGAELYGREVVNGLDHVRASILAADLLHQPLT